MGRNLTKEELKRHKEKALAKMEHYIDSLINSPDSKTSGKADKLSYWLEDWSTFLDFESRFSPSSLRRYKRGEIIKVHLGYNIGSEEGGLHYCVVVEKNNSKNSPVITVVPLTSVKKKSDVDHLHKGCIYLGNELYTGLVSKITYIQRPLEKKVFDLKKEVDATYKTHPEDMHKFQKDLEDCARDLLLLKRMRNEINKAKLGSIALVGQITTISKIRIYDPKTNFDILSNVKLSNEKLDHIDQEIISNFTNRKI